MLSSGQQKTARRRFVGIENTEVINYKTAQAAIAQIPITNAIHTLSVPFCDIIPEILMDTAMTNLGI